MSVLLLSAFEAGAIIRYVNQGNLVPVSPFTDWASAATNIQDAIDIAVDLDQIVVTNGVYASGGRVVSGLLTNRLVVNKAVQVRSVNGPDVTVIQGYQAPGTNNGDCSVRCVYLTNQASLVGFTLSSGSTRAWGDLSLDQSGGGLWAVSSNAIASNCVFAGNCAFAGGGGAYSGTLLNCTISSNSASQYGGAAYLSVLSNCKLSGNVAASYGGGVFMGVLTNCTLSENSAVSGGGAYSSSLYNCALSGNRAFDCGGGTYLGTLWNCTLVGNAAYSFGGGAYLATLTNCIAYFNQARVDANVSEGVASYCCTTPLPDGGVGNIQSDPQLANVSHLSATSPCLGAGIAGISVATDIDGELWANPPTMGCDEFHPASRSGEMVLGIQSSSTNVVVGYSVDLAASISGHPDASSWDFGDGMVVSNHPYASHTWADPGDYTVSLRSWNQVNLDGVVATVTIHVVASSVTYVAAENSSPVPPYNSWATAAANIQDAVDVAPPGGVVLVSDGVYSTGGRVVFGALTNRVAVTKPLAVQSLNGPGATVICGYQVPGATNGNTAIRCVYLANGASLTGFTVTNGATCSVSGDGAKERSGGGVWCESSSVVVSNCVFKGNSAAWLGGGAYDGTLNNCILTGNLACRGSGVAYSTLNNSILIGNRAYGAAGAFYATLNNCTLTGNLASNYAGGVYVSILNNCIVCSNKAVMGTNYYLGTLNYSCTTPMPTNGIGNFTNAPLFMDLAGGNLRLQSDSPCINSGQNASTLGRIDLNGNPRIVGGTVDVGAYEYQSPVSTISFAWLQKYGLARDSLADSNDPDQDGMSNWQEWIAGTSPIAATSALRMVSSTNSIAGKVVSWTSVTNRTYSLERASSLVAPPDFTLVQGGIPGQNNVTSLVDTNTTGDGPFFYRVRIEP